MAAPALLQRLDNCQDGVVWLCISVAPSLLLMAVSLPQDAATNLSGMQFIYKFLNIPSPCALGPGIAISLPLLAVPLLLSLNLVYILINSNCSPSFLFAYAILSCGIQLLSYLCLNNSKTNHYVTDATFTLSKINNNYLMSYTSKYLYISSAPLGCLISQT